MFARASVSVTTSSNLVVEGTVNLTCRVSTNATFFHKPLDTYFVLFSPKDRGKVVSHGALLLSDAQ